MNKLYFCFGIHNHQPVGNLDFVIEDAYQKSYLPFLEVLEKFPEIKVGYHCSGILYDWFQEKHPEFFRMISRLLRNDQLELLTGGYYEPILSMIPDRDKVDQIKEFSGYLRRKFVYSPNGMWLAERVWQPDLVRFLTEAKVLYTLVDEYHFNSVGINGDGVLGHYITEDNNRMLYVFPINKFLRYAVPFMTVDKIFEYFREIAERVDDAVLIFADDGEKFGVWPGTYNSVYKEKWLEEFFKRICDNSDWIEPAHFSRVLEIRKPMGRIYLPTASYSEMMKWALPAKDFLEYEKFRDEISESESLKYGEKFIRGGYWKNFLVKYPESNIMAKKAAYVSNKIPNTTGFNIKKHLYMGECNCPYWHGVFGGIYLAHLRHANYSHLIEAEYRIDSKKIKNHNKWLKKRILDFDCDGRDEIILENKLMNLYISPAYGGSLFELDLKGDIFFNLMNTIPRRQEGYHEKLLKPEPESVNPDEAVKEPSDLIRGNENEYEKNLVYDWYLRRSLLDHILALDTTIEKFHNMKFWEMGDFVNEPYQFKVTKKKDHYKVKLWREGALYVPVGKIPWKIEKVIKFFINQRKIQVEYDITNLSETHFNLVFGSEFNFSLLDCNNPAKKIFSGPYRNSIGSLTSIGCETDIREFGIRDPELGLEIEFQIDRKINLWYFPVETVSISETGFERVYQETCFLLNKQIEIPAMGNYNLKFDLGFNTVEV